jgi:hypothetical protein
VGSGNSGKGIVVQCFCSVHIVSPGWYYNLRVYG